MQIYKFTKYSVKLEVNFMSMDDELKKSIEKGTTLATVPDEEKKKAEEEKKKRLEELEKMKEELRKKGIDPDAAEEEE